MLGIGPISDARPRCSRSVIIYGLFRRRAAILIKGQSKVIIRPCEEDFSIPDTATRRIYDVVKFNAERI